MRRAKGKDVPEVPVQVDTMVLTRDADAIIGTAETAAKTSVVHAVIERAGGANLYCQPTKEILTPIDLGGTTLVTCNMCKEKLRTELT